MTEVSPTQPAEVELATVPRFTLVLKAPLPPGSPTGWADPEARGQGSPSGKSVQAASWCAGWEEEGRVEILMGK